MNKAVIFYAKKKDFLKIFPQNNSANNYSENVLL